MLAILSDAKARIHVSFQSSMYKLTYSDHAPERMQERAISEAQLVEVIETGTVKPKGRMNRFWVYKALADRPDNNICASLVIEGRELVVITVMHFWKETP